jgi:type IX secretion system PorP/SprF family membrane protein
MKKLIGLLLLILIGSYSVHAQQDPLYAQYLTTPMMINPAYAGYSHDLNGSVSYRKQWAGFDGSPVTMNASGHMALFDNRMGVGVMLVQDKIGSDQTTEAQLTYGYHLPLKDGMNVSFGLQGGVVNYKTDYSDLTINPDDPNFTPISEWNPTIGAGVMFSGETFLLSLSVPKMLKASSDADSLATGLYNRSFYGLGAYVFQINYRIKLKPYVLLRAVPDAPVSMDYGISMTGDDSYTLGLFTRDFNTLGFLAQINLGEMFRMGYVFELPTGQSVGTKYTTHEFMIGIRVRALKFHDLTTIRNF